MTAVDHDIPRTAFDDYMAMTICCYDVLKETVPEFQKIVEAENSDDYTVYKELYPELYLDVNSRQAFAYNMTVIRAVMQFVETVGDVVKAIRQIDEASKPATS